MGVDVTIVHKVLSATVLEIERNQTRIANPGLKDDPEALQEEMENNCLTSLYLVMILTKVTRKDPDKVEMGPMKDIYRLVQLNPRTSTGSTLLHFTVNQQTPVDDFHTNEVCKFPCASTSKLFLQADRVGLPHSSRHHNGSTGSRSPHRCCERSWTDSPIRSCHRGGRDHTEISIQDVSEMSRSSVDKEIQSELPGPGTPVP